MNSKALLLLNLVLQLSISAVVYTYTDHYSISSQFIDTGSLILLLGSLCA